MTTPPIPEPDVCRGDGGTCRHMMWATFPGDDETTLGFYAVRDGRVIVQHLHAGTVRGRDALRWLCGHGRPVHVVEVVPESTGFWERMQRDGLITDFDVVTDGEPPELERRSVAWRPARTRTQETP